MDALEVIEIVMQILGGMGTFLVGMKILSDNLTRLAHGKLQKILGKTAKSRFAGVGIGAIVTIIGQSSAFTTVMVVGLVNAGLMTLFQATSIIMGANIGTTLTAWVLSLGDFNVTVFFLCLTSVGIFMTMFSKKEKVKSAGNAIAALGLIFVGLEFMSSAFSEAAHPEFYAAMKDLLHKAAVSPMLLLVIGLVLTALVQSSTAVTALTLSMSSFFAGSGNAVYFIIVGSNIGTCITALISSLGASPNAKRAAVIHFLFNFFGAIIFTVLMVCWKGFADTVLVTLFRTNNAMQIAMFHTMFNVVNTLLFLPFVKVFVWLAEHIIPDKKKGPQEEEKKAESDIFGDLDERLLRSPSVALGYLYQQTGKVFSYAMDTLTTAFEAFIVKDQTAAPRVAEQNEKLAEANKKGVSYLVKLSASALVIDDEKTVSTLHYVLNDIVRIGELADNVTKYTRHYVEDELVFSDEFLEMTQAMYDKIKQLYVLSLAIFLYKDSSKLVELDALEDEIDNDRRALVARHIKRLNEGKCQPQNSSVFINLVGNLERAADHITFIAHSVE